MNTRMKQVMAAVALLAATGVSVEIAMQKSATCREWRELKTQQNDEVHEWFVLVADGAKIPSTVGKYTLGSVTKESTMALPPNGCAADSDMTYRFVAGESVEGSKLYYFKGPRYFAGAWRALAHEESDSVTYLGGWCSLAKHCAKGACVKLLASINDCWKRKDGQFCNHSRLYGPGVGGTQKCVVQADDVPYPCMSEHGPDWAEAVVDTDDEPADAEDE